MISPKLDSGYIYSRASVETKWRQFNLLNEELTRASKTAALNSSDTAPELWLFSCVMNDMSHCIHSFLEKTLNADASLRKICGVAQETSWINLH